METRLKWPAANITAVAPAGQVIGAAGRSRGQGRGAGELRAAAEARRPRNGRGLGGWWMANTVGRLIKASRAARGSSGEGRLFARPDAASTASPVVLLVRPSGGSPGFPSLLWGPAASRQYQVLIAGPSQRGGGEGGGEGRRGQAEGAALSLVPADEAQYTATKRLSRILSSSAGGGANWLGEIGEVVLVRRARHRPGGTNGSWGRWRRRGGHGV